MLPNEQQLHLGLLLWASPSWGWCSPHLPGNSWSLKGFGSRMSGSNVRLGRKRGNHNTFPAMHAQVTPCCFLRPPQIRAESPRPACMTLFSDALGRKQRLASSALLGPGLPWLLQLLHGSPAGSAPFSWPCGSVLCVSTSLTELGFFLLAFLL